MSRDQRKSHTRVPVHSPAEPDVFHPGFEHVITRGIRANKDIPYKVTFNGGDWNELLKFLVETAEEARGFDRIRKCVLFENAIRAQLTRQGF